MNDGLKRLSLLRILEYEACELAPHDLSPSVATFAAKLARNPAIGRRSPFQGCVGQPITVGHVGAQPPKHASHGCLPRCQPSREPDNVSLHLFFSITSLFTKIKSPVIASPASGGAKQSQVDGIAAFPDKSGSSQ
jgi:hypothetical protein